MGGRRSYERRVNITGGLWDAFKFYKSEHPKSVIDRKKYVDVCTLFNKMLSDKIVRESFEFKMFYKLGFLRIRANKLNIRIKDGHIDTKRQPINWVKTLELWKQLYGTSDRKTLKDIKGKKMVIHTNDHTNGYVMRWLWDKRGCNVANISVYKFSPVKGGITPEGYYYGRRGLAAWISNEERTNEYFL